MKSIVVKIKVSYQCKKCNERRVAGFAVIPTSIHLITQQINTTAKCYTCGADIMRPVKIECYTIKDTFGDNKFGAWYCPIHIYKYYPVPLRKAAADPIKFLTRWRDRGRLYIDIINSGFPWVCPLCKANLKYIDERRDKWITNRLMSSSFPNFKFFK